MKMERFVAKDMRSALNLIKATLGNEAVIHHSRKIDGGIEIEASVERVEKSDPLDNFQIQSKMNITAVDPNPITMPIISAVSITASLHQPYTPSRLYAVPDKKPASVAINKMQQEMALLRSLLQRQNSQRTMINNPFYDDHQRTVFQRLTQCGLHADLSERVVDRCKDNQDFSELWADVCSRLARQIPVDSSDPIDRGGIYAFLGPTGVGKTTTVAKLASRYVMKHGADSIGLITTDCYRVAGREQLGIYGQILDVPVMTVRDEDELARALNKMQSKQLVLVDTAGISQRDVALAQRLSLFQQQKADVRHYLVLSATSQQAIVEESLTRFGQCKLIGAILTKLDEATELGNIISIFIKHGLHLDYLNIGQRVPKDIVVANGSRLVDNMLDIEHNESHWLNTANIEQGVMNAD